MAAYYPDQPDNEQKANMKTLIKGFSKFYPCGYCATHLQEELKKNEPKVDNRSALSKWMCDIHNEVNERLGKPLFDCSKTDERWRDGPKDGSCD
ncbi:Flavin-linked sulfhydryl oxidase of the mitochondrial IMS [Basidiobolus ranarum]|uniref:Sulfhydryl oxidase n=1 Tax=Basidiobolus ranarum TaxID=34480 RepID=A0ABR2WPV4_9FUNG